MKLYNYRILLLLITLTLVFNGCNKDKHDTDDVSIIGKWKMYGNVQYGIEFTNYGILIWEHKPYMNSNLNYSYSGTTLIVSGVNGAVFFSDNGNTIKISGFSDPSNFGAEGATGPFINGTYIRQ